MTLANQLNRYFDKKLDAIALIRSLSGMFDPEHAVNLLSLICTITRHEQGDIDTGTFRSVWKIPNEEEIMFTPGGDYPQEYDALGIPELREELIKLKLLQDKMNAILYGKEEGPKVDDISIETDIEAISHDIELLECYILYRMKKEEDESEGQA